jgi:uncharacterized membrane protein YsdA (DUF1294 family)
MRPRPAAVRTRPTSAPHRRQDAPARPDRDLSRPLPPLLSWTVLAVFGIAITAAVLALGLTWWLPAWYLAASVVALLAYGVDKAAARRGTMRISEQTLLLLGIIGGWPGAVVAQQLFRHKTRKRSFRRAFWGSVAANVALAAAAVLLLAPGAVGAVPGVPGGIELVIGG